MLDTTRPFPEPPPQREPMFNIPLGTLIVLGGLIAIHALRQVIPESWDNQVLLHLAFLPGTFTYGVDPAAVLAHMRDLADQGDAGLRQAQLGRYILMNAGLEPWTVLTYGLLHADWTHIGLNSLWLLAFGSPVARRLATGRFLLFLGFTTLMGAVAHFLTHPVDLQPVIGASAAVSGCMGAALRFMFQPRAAVASATGFRPPTRTDAVHAPLLPLRGILSDRRATAFLVAWFAANLLFGIGVVALGPSEAAVAWEAHIGGFLAGLLALPLFDRRTQVQTPTSEASDEGETDTNGFG